MIRSLSLGTLVLLPTLHSVAQENPPKWDVEIPTAVAAPVETPQPEPEPINFTVLSTNTRQVEVTEPSELPGLPPVEGAINLTVETVDSPILPQPSPISLEAQSETTGDTLSEELPESDHSSDILFLSATVYASGHTLLTLHPSNGELEPVTAWSNLDFRHFQGLPSYHVKKPDHTTEDVLLVMGIGNADEGGETGNIPAANQLPDLTAAGPSFVIIGGSTVGKEAERIEQLHDLYRKEGATMQAAHVAREQEIAFRKAALLADPPQPQDVTIRYWKGEPNSTETEVAK